MVWFVFN